MSSTIRFTDELIGYDIEVHGLKSARKASRLPKTSLAKEFSIPDDPDYDNLAKSLGKAPIGSGHDCFLKGIIVTMELEARQHFWMQWMRYHFQDIVSSQSKMHCLVSFDIDSICSRRVTKVIKEELKALILDYKESKGLSTFEMLEKFETLMDNVPMGLRLRAGIVTNYLQLKSIYYQRRFHKMADWVQFCKWIESLPLMSKILGENYEKTSYKD